MNARYLIVGGGMAADAAVKAIRSADPQGRLVLVSSEPSAPYKRPPLSKGLWKGDDEAKIDLKTADTRAELLLGRTVERLDLANRAVRLDDGTRIGFDRLLLATGARARALPGLPESGRVIAYRDLRDYHRVKELAQRGSSAVIVGGGFIGSEMAAALTLAGVSVTMIFPEAAIGAGRFPNGLAHAVTRAYQERGVKMLSGRTLAHASESGDQVNLTLDDGTELATELVLVGIGAVPNDELAAAAGLQTANGILVDEHLRALSAGGNGEAHGVYAAGDVASFDWRPLGRRMRIEHEDNAYAMGAAAGREMVASLANEAASPSAPRPQAFDHLPFFYSDLFDAGYEAVGLLDTRLEVVEDWRKPNEEGVVYYLEDGRVRGVLLWNTWGQVDAARDLIMRERTFAPEELMGRLPIDD